VGIVRRELGDDVAVGRQPVEDHLAVVAGRVVGVVVVRFGRLAGDAGDDVFAVVGEGARLPRRTLVLGDRHRGMGREVLGYVEPIAVDLLGAAADLQVGVAVAEVGLDGVAAVGGAEGVGGAGLAGDVLGELVGVGLKIGERGDAAAVRDVASR